jgi:hypothetical protein
MIGTIPTYTQLPLCIDPGTHYFQLDNIKRDTAICTRCGLIRKQSVDRSQPAVGPPQRPAVVG